MCVCVGLCGIRETETKKQREGVREKQREFKTDRGEREIREKASKAQ